MGPTKAGALLLGTMERSSLTFHSCQLPMVAGVANVLATWPPASGQLLSDCSYRRVSSRYAVACPLLPYTLMPKLMKVNEKPFESFANIWLSQGLQIPKERMSCGCTPLCVSHVSFRCSLWLGIHLDPTFAQQTDYTDSKPKKLNILKKTAPRFPSHEPPPHETQLWFGAVKLARSIRIPTFEHRTPPPPVNPPFPQAARGLTSRSPAPSRARQATARGRGSSRRCRWPAFLGSSIPPAPKYPWPGFRFWTRST